MAGVAADDVLNLRAQAGAANPVVATLRPDATGIVLTGRQAGAGVWWEVVHSAAPQGAAWVNRRFLVPDGDAKAAGFDLRCVGTEPFWSLETRGPEARFTTPESKAPPWRAGGWLNAEGTHPGYRFAIRLDAPGQAVTGWATIWRPHEREYCSDQMSDFEYPYEITLVTPEARVLAGCCARAR